MTRSRIASGLLIAAAATAALPAATAFAQRGGGASIEGAGQNGTHDCHGGPAVIEGAGNTVRFTGACSGLRIEGASNIVTIDLAPGAVIRVEGASNEVSWSMPGNNRPRQSVEGAANRISRAR